MAQSLPARRPVPDFLGLGPERTGSTWLYERLKGHPGVYLTPIKELKYFFELQEHPREKPWQRVAVDGDWRTRLYRTYLRQRVGAYARKPHRLAKHRRRVAWDLRFLVGSRTDRWYRSLFAEAGDRLSGDISPQYFFQLDDRTIQHIRELNPRVRIMAVLRDPIEWTWSHAQLTFIDKAPGQQVSDAALYERFDWLIGQSSFREAIERWKRHFPPDQVELGFYDDLRVDPQKHYRWACRAIGADADATAAAQLARLNGTINRGRRRALPERFAHHLASRWRGEIERLCEILEPYPQRWLERCEETLAATGS